MFPDQVQSKSPEPQWFETTCWSVVLTAGRQESPQAMAALEQLCRTYWQPLYAYIRRRGYSPQDSQDLTQSFFGYLLERSFPTGAEPSKGRFRSYMLSSFNHFLANELDRANAARRGGGQVILSMNDEAAEELLSVQHSREESPEQAFERRWALALLDRALVRLGQEHSGSSKAELFETLKDFLAADAEQGEYAAAAAQLKLTALGVGVAVHRLRLRYRQLVRQEIAQTVGSPAEIDDEMRHLLGVLCL